MTEYRDVVSLIKKEPTDIWGLQFFPNLEPEVNNHRDGPTYNHGIRGFPNSDSNLEVVRTVVAKMGKRYKACLEIGVEKHLGNSFTEILIKNKPRGSSYIGVDIEDKSYLDDAKSNVYTLQCDSFDHESVRAFLDSKGISQIDILLIDSKHSVYNVINDWRYADLLSPNGVIILHDTNHHPGPIALCEAIDPDMFEVTKLCTDENDYGIAVIRRRS